jgi:hypothetical protein
MNSTRLSKSALLAPLAALSLLIGCGTTDDAGETGESSDSSGSGSAGESGSTTAETGSTTVSTGDGDSTTGDGDSTGDTMASGDGDGDGDGEGTWATGDGDGDSGGTATTGGALPDGSPCDQNSDCEGGYCYPQISQGGSGFPENLCSSECSAPVDFGGMFGEVALCSDDEDCCEGVCQIFGGGVGACE